MRQARIYSPISSPMQSGKKTDNKWLLEYIPNNTVTINPVAGCTSASDTMNQLHLFFASQEAAVNYAENHNINYELIIKHVETPKVKFYIDNFKASN